MRQTLSSGALLLLIAFCWCYGVVEAILPGQNCTEVMEGSVACYTCMGRDSHNCDWGKVCCLGSCWKLIDEEHDVIAKGCTENPNMPMSQEFDAQVDLPFADKESQRLTGTGHFCSDRDWCNSAARPPLSALLSLFVFFGIARLLRGF